MDGKSLKIGRRLLDEFFGESTEDVELFLQDLHVIRKLSGMTEDETFNVLESKLQGHAKNWLLQWECDPLNVNKGLDELLNDLKNWHNDFAHSYYVKNPRKHSEPRDSSSFSDSDQSTDNFETDYTFRVSRDRKKKSKTQKEEKDELILLLLKQLQQKEEQLRTLQVAPCTAQNTYALTSPHTNYVLMKTPLPIQQQFVEILPQPQPQHVFPIYQYPAEYPSYQMHPPPDFAPAYQTAPQSEQQQFFSYRVPKICFKCNRSGHIRKQCRSRVGDAHRGYRRQNYSSRTHGHITSQPATTCGNPPNAIFPQNAHSTQTRKVLHNMTVYAPKSAANPEKKNQKGVSSITQNQSLARERTHVNIANSISSKEAESSVPSEKGNSQQQKHAINQISFSSVPKSSSSEYFDLSYFQDENQKPVVNLHEQKREVSHTTGFVAQSELISEKRAPEHACTLAETKNAGITGQVESFQSGQVKNEIGRSNVKKKKTPKKINSQGKIERKKLENAQKAETQIAQDTAIENALVVNKFVPQKKALISTAENNITLPGKCVVDTVAAVKQETNNLNERENHVDNGDKTIPSDRIKEKPEIPLKLKPIIKNTVDFLRNLGNFSSKWRNKRKHKKDNTKTFEMVKIPKSEVLPNNPENG